MTDCKKSEMQSEEVREISKKQRTSNWNQSETFLFIGLCKEENVLKKMDGKRFRWNEVMIPVQQKMKQSEFKFSRDLNQLTNKLKSLKNNFRKAVSLNGESGEEEEMQDLMGARPRNTFPIAFAAESLGELDGIILILN